MAKRLMCVLLSVLMIVAMLPTGVFAADTVDTSGWYIAFSGFDTNWDGWSGVKDSSTAGTLTYSATVAEIMSANGIEDVESFGGFQAQIWNISSSDEGATYDYSISVDSVVQWTGSATVENNGYNATPILQVANIAGFGWGDYTFDGTETITVTISNVQPYVETTETVEATQTYSGTLTILDGADFTDTELYLYINYTFDSENYSDYSGWSLSQLFAVLEDGTYSPYVINIDSYDSCGGTYVISLVDLASTFLAAGYDVNEYDIATYAWGSSYGYTFVSAQLVRISAVTDDDDDDDDDDGEEQDEAIYTWTSTEDVFKFYITDYISGYSEGDTVIITATLESDKYFNGDLGADAASGWVDYQNDYDFNEGSGFYSSDGSSLTVSIEYTVGTGTSGEVQVWYMSGSYVNLTAFTVEYVSASSTTTPSFYGKTLSLGGQIGVNFYVDFEGIDDDDRADYSVQFTVDGATSEVGYAGASTSGAFCTEDILMFTCKVPCWEMGTTITAVITNGEDDVATSTYTVETYAKNVSTTSAGDLTSAMLTYGHYAYVLKGTGTDVAYSDVSDVDESDLEQYAVGTTLDSEIITASLTLDETCELSFTVGDDYTVSIDGEETDTLSDILVQDWDTEHTIVVKDSDGDEVYNFEYSVLSYAYTVVANSDYYDDELVDLVKAMYLYNVAADDYFD